MIAKQQIWRYQDKTRVWTGKYRNSHNLLHWHYDCELVYVENGSVDIFCEKQKHSLKKGQWLFIDSGQMHYQRANSADTVLALFVFDYNVISPFFKKLQLESPLLSHAYDGEEFYGKLRAVLTGKKPFYGAEAACMMADFMLKIFRQEALVPKQGHDKKAETFKQLLEVVEEQYGDYTFPDAVNYMGMSDAYFSRYFKAATGTTFSQYLNYVRVNNAIRFLRLSPDMPMTEISTRCGFATIRNFNRIFKELTGFAPSRLPDGFTLDDQFSYPSERAFNPTLYDSELIESSAE